MPRKWTTARKITASASVVLLFAAIASFSVSHKHFRQYKEWEHARPLNGPVDFSKPGEYLLPFHQTFSSAHGELISLRLPPSLVQHTNASILLSGASAQFEVLSPSGTNMIEPVVLNLTAEDEHPDGAVRILDVSPFPSGQYTARLKVTAGAPMLHGVNQTLEARYLLCGLEALPAAIWLYGGLGFCAISGILSLLVLFWRNPKPQESAPASD